VTTGPAPSFGRGGRQAVEPMHNAEDRSKSNIRLAIILGLIALGFFLMGIYLSMGKGD
jgi:hypothetical protein